MINIIIMILDSHMLMRMEYFFLDDPRALDGFAMPNS